MAATTSIEWTATVHPDGSVTPGRSWNPVTGCRKVSPGCKHCYAEGVAHRFWGTQYPAVPVGPSLPDGGPTAWRERQFTDVMTHEDRLLEPLSWRKPAKVFVNSMSDLFHEDVPWEFIDRVFAVMARAKQHTFQILTKRADRMRDYMTHADTPWRIACEEERLNWAEDVADDVDMSDVSLDAWPLPNVWLGVSVEDQPRADERIPLLLQTPAAVRFISAEPLLGAVDLSDLVVQDGHPGEWHVDSLACDVDAADDEPFGGSTLDWVIVGGESGARARPFNVAWARAIVRQCQAAGVPVFVKQLGSCITGVDLAGPPRSSPPRRDGFLVHWMCTEKNTFGLCDRKGGDPSEWPEDLRVREFPRGRP